MSSILFPMREVVFAAKMGFLSKALWLEFFATKSRAQNERNWKSFRDRGYFQNHRSKMLPNVLVLAPKAIDELQKIGIAPVNQPHLGQYDHDVKVSKIILGLENDKALERYSTEAELKKRFMVWMRTSNEGKTAKFPDVTIELKEPRAIKKVAVEVEQSLKNFERYKQIMSNYANAQTTEAVIFVSDQQRIFNRIARAMKAVSYPSWERPVGFGEMNEWLKNPTTAPIYLSRGTTCIRDWTRAAA